MLLLEFNRFVLDITTKEQIGRSGKLEKIQYNAEFDHTEIQEDLVNLEVIKQHIRRWTSDHYGYVKVYRTDKDVQNPTLILKRCNCRKFWRSMIQMGVLVQSLSYRHKIKHKKQHTQEV